jgi:hypothetical protein
VQKFSVVKTVDYDEVNACRGNNVVGIIFYFRRKVEPSPPDTGTKMPIGLGI